MISAHTSHSLLRSVLRDFCLIVLLDQPYRGEMGVSPAAFELIYGQLMKG